MSTITREFTKEQLQQIIETDHVQCGEASALARIALASLESEPVGYMNRFTGRVFTLEEQPGADTDAQVYVPLYTAPPAPVSVPDERAELQGADGTLISEGTMPATQIKPVADLYGISVPGGRTTTYSTDAAEASDCRVMGWSVQEYVKLERYQAAMLQGAENVTSSPGMKPAPALDSVAKNTDSLPGNSPAIPDGWVLVPIEPTEHMIVEGFESEPDEFFSDEEVWEAYDAMSGCQQAAHRAKICWAAMIAAAPKLE